MSGQKLLEQRTKSGLKIEMQNAQFLKFYEEKGEYHSKLIRGKKCKYFCFSWARKTHARNWIKIFEKHRIIPLHKAICDHISEIKDNKLEF